VQDLHPEAVERGRLSLPATLQDRITFQAHDFFSEQPIIADAYLFRNVLYDWPDVDVERIVKSLMPALRPNARVLVADDIVPKWGEKKLSPYLEKYLRSNDMSMFSACSGKARTLTQFCKLMERCDSRFRFEGIYCPHGSVCSLISWVYSTG
jgi:6-hydroxytryprostatin B O-methyltransferase